jgi:glycyl-tRNA synthetase alpha chain
MKPLAFQDIILKLVEFWGKQNCAFLQGYDVEVGAGTLHPSTALRALKKDKWNICYVQPSRRPKDGRFGENPNRLQSHHQMQVVLKPSPDNILELYLSSLKEIGIDTKKHDIRFVEDDWENPSIGAAGLGWEVWLDGMEVTQFTYMQQIGGIECKVIPGEITYGLERLALYIQQKTNIYDLDYNNDGLKYGDIYLEVEQQLSEYNINYANTDILLQGFDNAESESLNLLENKLPLPAYEQCLKASHFLNLLEARKVIGVTERANYMARVRNMAKKCCEIYMEV